MKKLKKIWMGALTATLFALVFLGLSAHKTSAIDGFSKTQIQNATFSFTDLKTIKATIGGKTVDFLLTGNLTKDDAGNVVNPSADQTTNPVGGYQYFAEQDISTPAASRPFCNNNSQENLIQAGSDNLYSWPQIGVIFTGDLSKAGDYSMKYANLNAGSTDAKAGPSVDPACASVTPTQKTINLAAQSQNGSAVAGAACSTPNANSSNNLTCACTDQGCAWVAATASSSTSQSCVGTDVGDGDLDWIICPIVKGIGEAGNAMNGFIQGQLNYNVNDNLGGATCPASSDKCSIHKAWTIFKDLISAVLVIILLVMVISQAIGGGPFEAYTIRKILPKLVVAVIGMQISWSVGIYLIQLANDAGQGIGQLLAAPFGGLAALDLPSLVARLSPTWSASFGGWVGVLVVGIGVYLFWPMMLLGAFTILVAVAAAMATLLIRNALIVLAIISAPLAILAWVMPGTQKFWKYWSSNFSKALMLFPLVMGLIYGGRIFAWVAGNLGSPGPFDFLMVFAGFVGPYIFLPKTFKWGGTILAQANNGIIKARDQLSKKPSEFFKTRQQGWNEERTRRSQERYANDVGFNPWRPWRRPLDLLKSGDRDPTLWGRRRQRAQASYVKKGEDSYQEDLAAAEARLVRERQRIRSSGGNHDHFLQAIAEGEPEYKYTDHEGNERTIATGGRSAIERNAARKQIAMLGAGTNYRYLEHYYESTMANGSPQEKADMRKFFDDNVETLRTRLPHIYKGIGSTADAQPDAIAQMHGAEIESMLGNLAYQIRTGTTIHGKEVNKAGAQRQLNTFLQNYLSAVKNGNLSGSLENGGLRAVKAFITDNDDVAQDLLGVEGSNAGINYEITDRGRGVREGRAVRGNIPAITRSKDNPDVAAAVANVKELDQLINEQGFVVGSPTAGTRVASTSGGSSTGSNNSGSGASLFPARTPGAGYEGNTAFGQPPASRSPGPLGAPSDFSIDHEAITNAVAEGVRQGAETLGQQVFENTMQAHRRAGLLDRQPTSEGTVQNITTIQGTTPGGVDIPRGVRSVEVPAPEPGEEIRPQDQQ